MTHPARLNGWRLARRSLGHRRRQTLLVVVVSALISGVAVFTAGYQHQVQQSVVDATLGVDGPGNAWSLTGAAGMDLRALLPPGSERLTTPPIEGRVAAVSWRVKDSTATAIDGSQRWRAEVCAHLVLVSGRCPSARGEAAVSAADVGNFGVKVGDELTVTATLSPARTAVVTGIYRVDDPENPYWFGVPPTGRSVVQEEARISDNLITVPDSFTETEYQETLDLRVNGPAVRLADLAELASYATAIQDIPSGEVRATSGVPDSLARIGQERQRAVAGLTLSLAQLAVLVGVVLALLTAVELNGQRAELGLGRLRGEPTAALRRMVVARWAAMVAAGWLLGWLPGLGLLALVAARSPHGRGLLLGPALLVVPAAVLLVTVALIVLPARALLAQPVISLLRSAPSAVRDTGGRRPVVDVALLILAVSGVLVAVQVGTDSVLGLLVPSLLAVGAGVALYLVLVRVMTGRRQTLAQEGSRPVALLQATLTYRLRGLRLLVIATSVAAAFAVFAVQLQAIGADVRRHDAQVRTGAAAVVSVDGDPAAVVAALDRFEPRHNGAEASVTPVVVTRRKDPRALRGMYVEPAVFPGLAYGGDRTMAAGTWPAIAAPRVEPVSFVGDTVTAQLGQHDALGYVLSGPPLREGTRAALGIDYRSADGIVRSAVIGQVGLGAGGGERLSVPVLCRDGCSLLRITVTPDGPMKGVLPLTALAAGTADRPTPLDLGPVDRWSFVRSPDSTDDLVLDTPASGPVLEVRSEGGALVLQHAWLPITVPVLVAAGARLDAAPTVAAPDGSQLAIAPVAETVDAVPGELDGVAVADLELALRAGLGKAGPDTSVQLWVSDAALGRVGELEQTMAEAGVRPLDTRWAEQATSANRVTAAGLSAQIAPGLAALAGVFAGLGVALTILSQRPVLGRDLDALRLAGVQRATVHRAATLTYLWPGLLAVVLGAAAGTIGCLLVIPGLPMLADQHPAIHNDVRPRVVPLVACAALAAGLLTAVVLLSVRLLSRGSTADPEERS